MVVEKNNKVTVEYEGRFDNKDGEIFDTSKDKKPLEFVTGIGMVVPGFDNSVIGMEKGDEKEITIKPEDGYGPYREELKQKVPRKVLPPEQEPKEGMMLMMATPQGQQMPAKIIKVDDENITLDINHPLAGKTLYFKIKVVDYEKVDMDALKKQFEEAQKQMAQKQASASKCGCAEGDPCKTGEEECKCEDEECKCEDETPSKDIKKDKEPSIEDLAEGK